MDVGQPIPDSEVHHESGQLLEVDQTEALKAVLRATMKLAIILFIAASLFGIIGLLITWLAIPFMFSVLTGALLALAFYLGCGLSFPSRVRIDEKSMEFYYRNRPLPKTVIWSEITKVKVVHNRPNVIWKCAVHGVQFFTPKSRFIPRAFPLCDEAYVQVGKRLVGRGIPVDEFKPPMTQIARKEMKKNRGIATIVLGLILGSGEVMVFHLMFGLPFLGFILINHLLALSLASFFVVFGLAEVLNKPEYMGYSIVTCFSIFTIALAILALGTGDVFWFVPALLADPFAAVWFFIIRGEIKANRGRLKAG